MDPEIRWWAWPLRRGLAARRWRRLPPRSRRSRRRCRRGRRRWRASAGGSCLGSDTAGSGSPWRLRGWNWGRWGMGSSSGCCSGSGCGADEVRARLGVAAGAVAPRCLASACDAGMEGAVLGDGGPGVAVGLDAGEAGRGCEGVAGEGGLVGDGGADRQGCLDRVRGVGGDDHGAGDFVAAGRWRRGFRSRGAGARRRVAPA